MTKFKKSFFLISAFLLCSNIALAENKVILDENFIDNTNKWYQKKSTNFDVKIANGKYSFDYKKTGVLRGLELKEINFDQGKNFKIETNINKVSGANNDSYDLIWGYKDKDNFYRFGVAGNGKFQIAKRFKGKDTNLISWTSSDKINKNNAENKLVISKDNSNYNFFINDSLVKTLPFQEFYGNKIGFAVNTSMKVEVENVKITQINTITNESNNTGITITEPKVIMSNAVAKKSSRGFEVVSKSDLIKVKGIAKDKSGISELTINGTKVEIAANGEFTAMVKINKTKKSLNIKSKDKNNNIKDSSFIIQ